MNISGIAPVNGTSFALQEVENVPLGKLVEVFRQHPDWYSPDLTALSERKFSSSISDVSLFLQSAIQKQCLMLHQFIEKICLTDSIECQPPELDSTFSPEIYSKLNIVLIHNYEHRAMVERLQAHAPDGLEFEHFKALMESMVSYLASTQGVLSISPQESRIPEPFSLDSIPDDNLRAMAFGIAKYLGSHAHSSVQLHLSRANLTDAQVGRLATQLQSLLTISRVRSVDLSYNQLTDVGFRTLLDKVNKMTPCTSIDMKGNHLTDASLLYIAEWFGDDQSAITFDLSKNPQMHKYAIPKSMEDKFLVTITVD